MTIEKCHYDLVCSLGGNCAAAFQLRFRGLRLFSLPFDWVYIEDTQPIEYLCKGFVDGFQNLALKENMKRVKGNEAHSIIYQDKYSSYFFPNHFKNDLDKEYDDFAKKLRRRIERLIEKIRTAKNVLFILSTTFPFDISSLEELNRILVKLYPNVHFDFEVVSFGCVTEEDVTRGNIHQQRCVRQQNLYDFYKTNFEWSFLDDIELQRRSHQQITLCSVKAFGRRFRLNFEIRRNKDA